MHHVPDILNVIEPKNKDRMKRLNDKYNKARSWSYIIQYSYLIQRVILFMIRISFVLNTINEINAWVSAKLLLNKNKY